MREVFGVLGDLGRLLMRERAWWMIPILVSLAVVAVVVVIATVMPAAPFLYPLF